MGGGVTPQASWSQGRLDPVPIQRNDAWRDGWMVWLFNSGSTPRSTRIDCTRALTGNGVVAAAVYKGSIPYGQGSMAGAIPIVLA